MTVYYFILIGLTAVQCLTCNEVLNMTTKKQLSLKELKMMSAKDINDCLQHIASEPLKIEEAKFIWNTLVRYYEGISNIPENILSQLHWATVAIPPEDYANINIDSIDIVRNFGLSYNLHYAQLEAIAERVRKDFADKMPEDYTYYDLVALNEILCAFNRSEIERIHPEAYRESAWIIGKIKNCQADAMIGFANLATHKNAFGPIGNWTGLILKTVGNVAEYVDIPKDIKEKLESEMKKLDDKEDFLYEFQMFVDNIRD